MGASQAGRKPDTDSKAPRRSGGELARTGAIVLLAVIFTIFAVLNLGKVEVNWIVGSGHAPLIVVIAISVIVGVLITYGAERRNRRRRER